MVEPSSRRRFAVGFLGSVGVKLAATGLGFGVTVALVRLLGPEEFGTYSYVFALMFLLAVPAQLGLPPLALRETAAAQVRGDHGRMRGILIWSLVAILLSSAGLFLVTLGALALHPGLIGAELRPTFYWGLLTVPLLAFMMVFGTILRGLRRIVLGQIPNDVLRPALFLGFILVMLAAGIGGSAETAMLLHAVAAAAALGASAVLLVRVFPRASEPGAPAVFETRAWLLAILPLAFSAGMQQILKRVDVVMLGALGSDMVAVGAYRVAVQYAMLLLFFQSALNMVMGPYAARLKAASDRAALQQLTTLTARLGFATAAAIGALFLLYGEPMVTIVFGAEYRAAALPLRILAAGYMVVGFFGPPALLLNMAGHERVSAQGVALALGANVVLNALLIPTLGMVGAAAATGSSLVLWKVFLWWKVRRLMGVDSAAFAFLPAPSAASAA